MTSIVLLDMLKIIYRNGDNKIMSTTENSKTGNGNPNISLGLYYDGVDLFEEGKYAEAYEAFSKSADLAPHYKTYERLYETCLNLGCLEKGFSFLRKAYNLNRKNDKLATTFARELLNHDEVHEARNVVEEVLKRNQSYGPARKLLDSLDS